MAETQTNIRVVIRVRPFNRQELEQNQRNIIRVLDKSNLMFDPEDDHEEFFYHGVKQTHRDLTKRVRKKMNMEYDDIFDWDANNSEIFEISTKPLIESLMQGYNCSVFVYGATGAGKTYTMLGSAETPGITFLTMKALFDRIGELEDDRKFEIGISYLEVYNEQVMNLLTKSGPMNLREDGNGVVVSGLSLKQIHNASELLDLLAQGNRNRTQHPTDANAESSRSHAIFQVHIRMTDKKTSQKKMVKLSMIDLAGSERAASTQCKGLRFKEGANINRSLLALGNCINKLADGSKYVPYRDSKLTRILKDSLGGNCKTVMIANVSPSSLTYDDTYNTLKYASRAKKIKTSLRQNLLQSSLPKEYLVKKVNEQQNENERLKAKIKELEARLAESESRNGKSAPIQAFADTTTSPVDVTSKWISKIDEIHKQLNTTQDHYFAITSKDKLVSCKNKLKGYLEGVRNLFDIEGMNDEITRIEASIDRSVKQLTKHKEDMNRWAKRHHEAERSLENLKQEILESSSGSDLALQYYIQQKDTELQKNKMKLKLAHMEKINVIYNQEFEHWKDMATSGFELLNQLYLLVRASGRADKEMQNQITKLYKLCQGRQKVVKFLEDEVHQESEPNDMKMDSMENITESPQSTITSTNKTEQPSTGKKRPFSDDAIQRSGNKIMKVNPVKKTTPGTFVKPKAVKAINFTSKQDSKTTSVFKVPTVAPIQKTTMTGFNVTHTINPDNLNSTFDIESPVALSENAINIKDSGKFEKMKQQTRVKLIDKAAITLNKENKKFTPKKTTGVKSALHTIHNNHNNGLINKARVKPVSSSSHNKGPPR
uniref:CSON001206 protein n=1 Tax=Culicoides sonorensis TaxID=179676 RepID=A0A336KW17_CULSO